MNTVVGHVTVEKAFNLDRQHESAAQYHTIRVEPGEYPIVVDVSRRIGAAPYTYVRVDWSGIVLSSGYGGRRYTEEEGKPGEVSTQPYKYELRKGLYYGCRVTLTDVATLETANGV